MTSYFITGLPRSRTAWLANLMTYGPSFCWHDALQHGVLQLRDFLARPICGITHIGNSDSGLSVQYGKIESWYPAPRWVFIRRDREEAMQSFLNYFRHHWYQGLEPMNEVGLVSAFDQYEASLDRAISMTPIGRKLVVDFDSLENETSCRAIWEHCIPDHPFCSQRWHLLNQLRINVIPEKVNASALA